LPFSGLNDKSSLVVQEMVQAAGSVPTLLRLVFIEIILTDEVLAFPVGPKDSLGGRLLPAILSMFKNKKKSHHEFVTHDKMFLETLFIWFAKSFIFVYKLLL